MNAQQIIEKLKKETTPDHLFWEEYKGLNYKLVDEDQNSNHPECYWTKIFFFEDYNIYLELWSCYEDPQRPVNFDLLGWEICEVKPIQVITTRYVKV